MNDAASGGDTQPATVCFPSAGGTCEGDLYLPFQESAHSKGPPQSPVVVMAHGIGAERTFGLAGFAQRFVARGLAVLVFDYRHFGGSTGDPRYLVSPSRQLKDFQAALAFVRSDARLDPDRIGLWGTSFSGGHVLVTAARAPEDIRAVVAQVPFVSGLASTLAFPLRYHLPAILLGMTDRIRGAMGRSPLTVPVVQPKGLALLASPDSHDAYMAMVPDDTDWTGRLPARVFLAVLAYHPTRSAGRVRAPTLLLGATEDAVCPMAATRRVARRLPDGRLEEHPVGHFDPYQGEWFERFASRAADFLEARLRA